MSRCPYPLLAQRCPECGAIRLGEDVTELGALTFHGATAAGTSVRAAYPGPWPTCCHGHPWQANCRNRPVPPACCRHPPCALVPPFTSDTKTTS